MRRRVRMRTMVIMTRRALLLGPLTVLLALGCRPVSSEPTTAPSGRAAWAVECRYPADCYSEASRVCGGRYGVIGSFSGVGHRETRHTLVVQCGRVVIHRR